ILVIVVFAIGGALAAAICVVVVTQVDVTVALCIGWHAACITQRCLAFYRAKSVDRTVFDVLFRIGIAFHDTMDAGQEAVFVHINECDGLRGATHLANFGHTGTHQHAGGGDKHDFVGGTDQDRAHDFTVAGGGLNSDHPLGATPMPCVFSNGCALTESVFGGGEYAL